MVEGKTSYEPSNLKDGSIDPWCVKQGSSQKNTFTFEYTEPITLDYVHILNGFAKGDLYRKNNRIASLNLIVDKQFHSKIDFPDTIEHEVYLASSIKGKEFQFEIDEVYKGEKYNDTCISEFSLNSNYVDPSVYNDIYCSHLFKNFKSIAFDDKKGNYITLLPDGKLIVSRPPGQMDVFNEGKGTWKIVEEYGKKYLKIDYKLKVVINGNDDLTSNESRLYQEIEEESFEYSLETDNQCSYLGEFKKVIIVEDFSSGFSKDDNQLIIYRK